MLSIAHVGVVTAVLHGDVALDVPLLSGVSSWFRALVAAACVGVVAGELLGDVAPDAVLVTRATMFLVFSSRLRSSLLRDPPPLPVEASSIATTSASAFRFPDRVRVAILMVGPLLAVGMLALGAIAAEGGPVACDRSSDATLADSLRASDALGADSRPADTRPPGGMSSDPGSGACGGGVEEPGVLVAGAGAGPVAVGGVVASLATAPTVTCVAGRDDEVVSVVLVLPADADLITALPRPLALPLPAPRAGPTLALGRGTPPLCRGGGAATVGSAGCLLFGATAVAAPSPLLAAVVLGTRLLRPPIALGLETAGLIALLRGDAIAAGVAP